MKKRTYLLAVLSASALMLSACSSGGNNSSEEKGKSDKPGSKVEVTETTAKPGNQDVATTTSTEDITVIAPVTGSNSIYDGLEGWEILKKCYEYTDEMCNYVNIKQVPSEKAIETKSEFREFSSRRFRVGDQYYNFYNNKDNYDGEHLEYQFSLKITNHEALVDNHYLSLKSSTSTNYSYIHREVPADSSANQSGEHYLLGHHWYDYEEDSKYTTEIDGDTIIVKAGDRHIYYIKDGFMVKEELFETMDGEFTLARTLIFSDYGTASEEYPKSLLNALKRKDYMSKDDMFTFAEYMGLE